MKNYWRLLRYEARKLSRSKLLYLAFAAASLFPAFSMLMAESFYVSGNPNGAGYVTAHYALSSYGNLTLTPVLALLIGYYFTEDYKNGAIKNVLGRGYGKGEFYWAKVTALGAVSLLFLLLADFAIYGVGAFIGGSGDLSAEQIHRHLWNFAGAIALISTFLGLASLFRRPAGSMLSSLLIPPAMVAFFFVAIDLAILSRISDIEALSIFFLPYFFGYTELFLAPVDYPRAIGLAFFLVVPILVGYFLNRKRDVK